MSAKNPWRDRLDRMKKYQDAHCGTWNTNADLLFGKMGDDPTKNQCAYGWGLVQSLITQIYIQNPECLLEAYKDLNDMQDEIARLLSYIVPYDWDQMDIKSLGNLGILDNFVQGYSPIIETVETEKRAHRFPGEEVTKAHKPKGKKDEGEEVEEEVASQSYVARRINPWDILFDPQGTLLDLSDHRYIAIAFYPTVAAVKEDPIFSQHLPKDEEIADWPEVSTYTRRNKGKGTSRDKSEKVESDPDFKQICLWEIHDKINGEIVYMTDHKHHELGRIKLPFDLKINNRKFFPVTLMAFFPSQTGFYPTPVIDLIANQLATLNRLDARIYKDALTKWRKFAAWGDALDQDQKDKIVDESPDNALISVDADIIGTLAGVEGQAHAIPSIKDVVAPIQDPAPNQDVMIVREMCINEISEIIGWGAAGRGGMPKTRSAREAMAVKERQDQRLHRLADAITTFYEWFGQKHILILQQTMEVERYAKVFTDEVQKLEAWKSYTRDDIQGEFHFKVMPGTTMPRNTESKRQQELSLFQAIAPILQQAGLPLQPAFMRLASAFQWKGVEQLFKNPKAVAKQAAQLLAAIAKGEKVPPNALPDTLAGLVRATLSDGELQQVKQEIEGGGGGGEGTPPAKKGERGDPTREKTNAGVI